MMGLQRRNKTKVVPQRGEVIFLNNTQRWRSKIDVLAR
jgi:hypothetical protein